MSKDYVEMDRAFAKFMDMDADIVPFHTSWEWLMKAVEKIQTMTRYCHLAENQRDNYGFHSMIIVYGKILNHFYWLECEQLTKELDEEKIAAERYGEKPPASWRVVADSKFDAIYRAAWTFINWYNNK